MRAAPNLLMFLVALSACDSIQSGHEGRKDQERAGVASPARPTTTSAARQSEREGGSRPMLPASQAKTEHDQPSPTPPAAAQENMRLCSAMCQTTGPLGCASAEDCASACLEMTLLPHCSAQLNAFLKCSGQQPATSFECSDGQPSLKEGLCSNEQRGFLRCLESAFQ